MVLSTRLKLLARISCPRAEFTSVAGAGWRVPPSSSLTRQRRLQQDTSVEPIQVSIPGREQQLELRLKQSFTVSPGSVSSANDMTGTRVWPTAKAIVTRLSQDLEQLGQRQDKTSLRIVELGSGCGLLGLTLAAMGNEVLLTDHAGNVDWLRQNVDLNETLLCRAKTEILDWGAKDHISAITAEFSSGGLDAIVGTDLIYDLNCHGALVDTMRQFSELTRAPVFLGYPNRDSSEAAFFETAKEYFDIETSFMGDDESNLMYAVFRIRK